MLLFFKNLLTLLKTLSAVWVVAFKEIEYPITFLVV